MGLPGGGFALDEGPKVGPPELEVDVGVQTLPILKHHSVGVLSVQHQLGCHQINLHVTELLTSTLALYYSMCGSRCTVSVQQEEI